MKWAAWWALVIKEFGGGLAQLEHLQHQMPFVEIQMVMGEMNAMYRRAKRKAKREAQNREREAQSLDEIRNAVGGF